MPVPASENRDFAPIREHREEPAPQGITVIPDMLFELVAPDAPQPVGNMAPMIVGGDVLPPRVIEETKSKPRYPLVARTARREGDVVLQAIIQVDGSVGEITVLRVNPSGFGFEEAATEAVGSWRFRPATQNGRPVAVFFTVNVGFDLN
jgi:TonB family protein